MTKMRGACTGAEARFLWGFVAALKGRSSTVARTALEDCSSSFALLAALKRCTTPSLVRVVSLTCAGEVPAATRDVLVDRDLFPDSPGSFALLVAGRR